MYVMYVLNCIERDIDRETEIKDRTNELMMQLVSVTRLSVNHGTTFG